ncbi:hypothetical protein, partial [Bacillus anthracis]|uniref:hypothetical protein n=1 Tax=Bacillus anthracis TaxID=1392 RepID=UPI001E542ED1
EELREYYNSRTVSELFALYTICSTTADKGSEVVPTEKWYECVFLKRKFQPHDTRPGMYLSPLDLESLKSITQYVWESPNLMISTFGNCEAAVLQAHGHGKQFFNEFKDNVNHALVAQGIQPVGLQWRSIDAKFFGSGIDTEQM